PFVISTTYAIANLFFFYSHRGHRALHSFPTRRSSDLVHVVRWLVAQREARETANPNPDAGSDAAAGLEHLHARGRRQRRNQRPRSEEHTSELQSRSDLVCRLLLEKKKKKNKTTKITRKKKKKSQMITYYLSFNEYT